LQKKNKANLALGLSAAGFVGTLGLDTGFVPGLLHHGFLAATVGGLADWFAVTAIFHRPLGISYRTDILRRNRGRIMEALVTFASDDLLSVEHIMGVVSGQDTGRLMAEYIEQRGGRERVQAVVQAVLLRAAETLDVAALAEELAPVVQQQLGRPLLTQVSEAVLRQLAEPEYAAEILQGLLRTAGQVVHDPAMQEILLQHVTALREAYEGDSMLRNMVMGLMGDDQQLLQMLNTRLDRWLEAMLAGEGEAYEHLVAAVSRQLARCAADAAIQQRLAAGQNQLLQELDTVALLTQWLTQQLCGPQPFWLTPVQTFLDGQLTHFCQSEALQRHFDHFLKQFLRAEFTKHHALIPDLIRERLNEFSDDQLVTFVEGKVADDLQMIRINGALVGALVGMGLFLVVTAAERMWGL